MKRLILVFVLASVAIGSFAEAVIDRVVVRQRWPWSEKTKVSYRITGVTSPVDLNVSFSSGGETLSADAFATNFTGTVLGICSSGEYSFEFDPAVVFGTAAISELTVSLAPVASPYTKEQLTTPIYRILDLENKTWEDLTAQDLFSNRYGTYETNYVTAFAPNWTSPKLTVRDCIIWTGVTNGHVYRTSKLALRRIPARSYGTWTMGCDTDAKNTLAQRQVVLTNDYWMGVFKFTQDQHYRYMNSYGLNSGFITDNPFYGDHRYLPVMYLQFANVRGDSTTYVWPTYGHAVAPSSCLGKMKSAFSNALAFDIATEAQWEFACRGGCTAYQYNGLASTDAINFTNASWTQYNSYTNAASPERVKTCVPRAVGLLIPNAFGLYDMIGDSHEWVLDRYQADYLPEGDAPYVDPWGPTDTSITTHVTRSRGYQNAGMHSAFRSNGSGNAAGFRLCITIPPGE